MLEHFLDFVGLLAVAERTGDEGAVVGEDVTGVVFAFGVYEFQGQRFGNGEDDISHSLDTIIQVRVRSTPRSTAAGARTAFVQFTRGIRDLSSEPCVVALTDAGQRTTYAVARTVCDGRVLCAASRSNSVECLRAATSYILGRRELGATIDVEALRRRAWAMYTHIPIPPPGYATDVCVCTDAACAGDECPLRLVTPAVNAPPMRCESSALQLLFRLLPVEGVAEAVRALLLEAKTVVHTRGDAVHVLTPVCEAIKALMYPLTWVHTCIPVLPMGVPVEDVLESPCALLLGTTTDRLPRLAPDVVVIDLDQGTIQVPGDDQATAVPASMFAFSFSKQSRQQRKAARIAWPWPQRLHKPLLLSLQQFQKQSNAVHVLTSSGAIPCPASPACPNRVFEITSMQPDQAVVRPAPSASVSGQPALLQINVEGVLKAFTNAMLHLFGDFDDFFVETESDAAPLDAEQAADASRYLGLTFDKAAFVARKPDCRDFLEKLLTTQAWEAFLTQRLSADAWTDPEVLYFDALWDTHISGLPSPFLTDKRCRPLDSENMLRVHMTPVLRLPEPDCPSTARLSFDTAFTEAAQACDLASPTPAPGAAGTGPKRHRMRAWAGVMDAGSVRERLRSSRISMVFSARPSALQSPASTMLRSPNPGLDAQALIRRATLVRPPRLSDSPCVDDAAASEEEGVAALQTLNESGKRPRQQGTAQAGYRRVTPSLASPIMSPEGGRKRRRMLGEMAAAAGATRGAPTAACTPENMMEDVPTLSMADFVGTTTDPEVRRRDWAVDAAVACLHTSPTHASSAETAPATVTMDASINTDEPPMVLGKRVCVQCEPVLQQAANVAAHLRKQVQRLAANLQVHVRVKPARRSDSAPPPALQALDAGTVAAHKHAARAVGGPTSAINTWSFERVFAPHHDQSAVFEELQAAVEDVALSGINTCILAYGQTGSGKTFSMSCGPCDLPVPVPYLLTMPEHNVTTLDLPDHSGVYARSIVTVFADVAQLQDRGILSDVSIRVAVYEVYRENIVDLLRDVVTHTAGCECGCCNGHTERAESVRILGTPASISLIGLAQPTVTSARQALAWVTAGLARRSAADNGINARSSRSHCIVQLSFRGVSTVQLADAGAAAAENRTLRRDVASKLCLVDLAGSERLAKAELARAAMPGADTRKIGAELPSDAWQQVCAALPQIVGAACLPSGELLSLGRCIDAAGAASDSIAARMKESTAINQSLTSLGMVINALADTSSAKVHVPYRDSVLTHALSDCLGGSARTIMLCTVSSDVDDVSESVATLDFAARARNVKSKPVSSTQAAAAPPAVLKSIHQLEASVADKTTRVLQLEQQLQEANAEVMQLRSRLAVLESAGAVFSNNGSDAQSSVAPPPTMWSAVAAMFTPASAATPPAVVGTPGRRPAMQTTSSSRLATPKFPPRPQTAASPLTSRIVQPDASTVLTSVKTPLAATTPGVASSRRARVAVPPSPGM